MTMQTILENSEITVAYINDPKPGKRWGNIKSTSGDLYWGPPAMLARYQKGETCKVEYELGGNDGTLRTLKRKIEIPQALQRSVPPQPRARTNPTDSEQIFVTALLKEMVTPTDTTSDVVAKVTLLRDAYRNTFGSDEVRRDDQMRDEIPY